MLQEDSEAPETEGQEQQAAMHGDAQGPKPVLFTAMHPKDHNIAAYRNKILHHSILQELPKASKSPRRCIHTTQ